MASTVRSHCRIGDTTESGGSIVPLTTLEHFQLKRPRAGIKQRDVRDAAKDSHTSAPLLSSHLDLLGQFLRGCNACIQDEVGRMNEVA